MTIGNIIDKILTPYEKGIASDDTRASPRFVYSKMLDARNVLINQQQNKTQKVSQWVYQTLPCVELIKAPTHECPCLPAVGCTIYKTKYKLPETLVNLDRHLIQSVTSIDGTRDFSETSWEEKQYKSGNRYTANKPDYYIRSGYLYVTQKTGSTLISITGLWTDPLEAYAYPSHCDECEDGPCYDCDSVLDKEFLLDAHKIDTLVDMVNKDMAFFRQGVEDRSSNTADSPEEQSK